MRSLKLTFGSMILVAAAFLTACAGGAYYAYSAPPVPRAGLVVGVAPGPGFVWTDGWWDRRGNSWYWESGRWVRPPRQGAVWVAPRWEQRGHSYYRHPGQWR